jgi:prephenate dehydrogenase
VRAPLARPWPELIAAGPAAVARQGTRQDVRIPLERAALLSLGRAGGALTRRSAAFLEGWLPDPG